MASIPKTAAKFSTSLASKITSSANSMTLVSGTDKAGNALSGLYGFVVDKGSASEEFMLGTVSGTTVTITARGLDPVDGETEVSALKFAHRRGATVEVTDYPLLAILLRCLNGDETIPNKLSYASHPTFSSNTEIVDKKYVDDTAFAGAPDASTTAKGVLEEATQAEIDADTGTGGTGARLAVNPSTLATSKYGTQLPSSGQKSALTGSSGTPGGSNKYITEDDVSAAGASGKVVRATGTALPALSAANLTNLPLQYKCGTTTKDSSEASTTQTIAHGLGTTPKYVRITARSVNSSVSVTWLEAITVYNGTTQASQSVYLSGGTATTADNTFSLNSTAGSASHQRGVVTFDGTNITITWTKTNNPTGTYQLLWEAFA